MTCRRTRCHCCKSQPGFARWPCLWLGRETRPSRPRKICQCRWPEGTSVLQIHSVRRPGEQVSAEYASESRSEVNLQHPHTTLTGPWHRSESATCSQAQTAISLASPSSLRPLTEPG